MQANDTVRRILMEIYNKFNQTTIDKLLRIGSINWMQTTKPFDNKRLVGIAWKHSNKLIEQKTIYKLWG